jgi:hypothetical protein
MTSQNVTLTILHPPTRFVVVWQLGWKTGRTPFADWTRAESFIASMERAGNDVLDVMFL